VAQIEDYGYVSYTHAVGIDAPVGMVRNREVVMLGHHRQTPPIGAPLVQYVRRMFGFNSEADANAYACSVTTHRSGLAGEMCR